MDSASRIESGKNGRVPSERFFSFTSFMMTIRFWINQIFCLTIFILLVIWLAKYKSGFGWVAPKQQFSWHALMSVVGFVIFLGNGMTIYLTLPIIHVKCRKFLHAMLNGFVILFVAIGLWAVIDERNKNVANHFMSLHSWIGIIAIAILVLQWCIGLCIFYLPIFPDTWKLATLPWHMLCGMTCFMFAVVAALIGLHGESKNGSYEERMIVNSTGIIILAFAMFVLQTIGGQKVGIQK